MLKMTTGSGPFLVQSALAYAGNRRSAPLR